MIKTGTTNINKVNYQGTISKALKGTDLIWESKSWVLVKRGTTPSAYDDNWSFKVKADEKIKIVPNDGLLLDIDIYEGDNSVDHKRITKEVVIERNKDFEVKVLSIYARRQDTSIFIYR